MPRLFDLPSEAEELLLAFVEDPEDKRALRLTCKDGRALVNRAVTAVTRCGDNLDQAQRCAVLRAPRREVRTQLSTLLEAPWNLLRLELS